METFRRDANNRKSIYSRIGSGTFLPLISVGIVIVAWTGATHLFTIPAYLLPTPEATLGKMTSEWSLLLRHLGATALSAIIGLAFGTIAGAFIGLLLAFSRVANGLLYPVLIGSNALPKLALAPVLIVWLGFGRASKVAIALLITVFPIAIGTLTGLRSIPKDMLDLARSMNGSPVRIFRKVRVPYAMPSFFSGLRVAVPLSIVGAVVGEFVGGSEGLGYLVLIAGGEIDGPMMFASLLTLVGLAISLYLVVEGVAFILTPGNLESSRSRKAHATNMHTPGQVATSQEL